MTRSRSVPWLAPVLLALIGLIPACGDDDGSGLTDGDPTPASEVASSPVPSDGPDGEASVDELAVLLLSAEEIGAGWSEGFVTTDDCTGPDDCEAPFDGIITDAIRPNLPVYDLCPEAGPEAEQIMASLPDRWQVGRPYTWTPAGSDQAGVGLTELVAADDPTVLAEDFAVLAEAVSVCFGVPPAEGFEITPLPLPEGDDDNYVAATIRLTEPGRRIDTHIAVVLDGDIVVWISADELVNDEPQLTDAEFAAIVTTAIDKLA